MLRLGCCVVTSPGWHADHGLRGPVEVDVNLLPDMQEVDIDLLVRDVLVSHIGVERLQIQGIGKTQSTTNDVHPDLRT
jgi:hypothetical protein